MLERKQMTKKGVVNLQVLKGTLPSPTSSMSPLVGRGCDGRGNGSRDCTQGREEEEGRWVLLYEGMYASWAYSAMALILTPDIPLSALKSWYHILYH